MNTHPPYRATLIAVILGLAVLAFEIFNFDTTRFALTNLLGDVAFYNMSWSAILAVAFCGIDLAGLLQMFALPAATTHRHAQADIYLFGAWLLGATLNALMTWYAVGLTLLEHEIGNELLSRAQLIRWVPLLVAILVWLTRILFIAAIAMMGEYLQAELPSGQPRRRSAARQRRRRQAQRRRPVAVPQTPQPAILREREPVVSS